MQSLWPCRQYIKAVVWHSLAHNHERSTNHLDGCNNWNQPTETPWHITVRRRLQDGTEEGADMALLTVMLFAAFMLIYCWFCYCLCCCGASSPYSLEDYDVDRRMFPTSLTSGAPTDAMTSHLEILDDDGFDFDRPNLDVECPLDTTQTSTAADASDSANHPLGQNSTADAETATNHAPQVHFENDNSRVHWDDSTLANGTNVSASAVISTSTPNAVETI